MNHPEYEFLKDIFEDVESIDSIEEKKKNKAFRDCRKISHPRTLLNV